MLQLRRWLFLAHLTSGALAGLLILFFAVTGAMLAYQRPILAHADAAYTVHAGSSRLPIAELLYRAPFHVTAITMLARPDAPIELTAGRRDLYMVNPYTGDILGLASPRLRRFFVTLTSLHRWFGLEDHHRAAASAVKGAANLVFLFLVISGAVLWLPKRYSGSALRIRSRFVKRASWRARAWNWHHVVGLWLGLPLLIMVLTGTVMAYPWATAMLFRIAGTPVPRQSRSEQTLGESARTMDTRVISSRSEASKIDTHRADSHTMDLDSAFAAVASQHAGWHTITLRLQPASAKPALAFTVEDSDGGHPAARTIVTVTPRQNAPFIVQQTPFREQPKGQRWRIWVRFTHTGEAAGWVGETIALITALGACVLGITGLLMLYQRLITSLRRSTPSLQG